MNILIKTGMMCNMCGSLLPEPLGKEGACTACEYKLQQSSEGVPEGDEVRDLQNIISAPYLSAVCLMLAEQIINREAVLRPTTKEGLAEELSILMRHHAPIAYAYYFQSYGGDNPLPTGTVNIVLDYIWANPLTADYLGGKNSGIILPGQF